MKYKHEQVIEHLYAHYINNNRDVGLLPSEPKLANELGISRFPVHQAFNKLVSAGVLVRVMGVGTFIKGKEPRKFVMQTSPRIAGIVSFVGPLNPEIQEGLQSELSKNGILSVNLLSKPGIEHSTEALERITESDIKNVFVIPDIVFENSSYNPNLVVLEDMMKCKVRPIIVERFLKGFDGTQIVVDNSGGTRLAIEWLLQAGYKKIAYIGKNDYYVGKERFKGYLDALRNAGTKIDNSLIYLDQSGANFVDLMSDFVKNAVEKIMQSHPDCQAFSTFGGKIAYETYKYIKAVGALNDKTRFAGYDICEVDDDDFLKRYILLKRPMFEIGRNAARELVDQEDNTKNHYSVVKRILPDIHINQRNEKWNYILRNYL